MDIFNKKQNKLVKFFKYLKNHLYDDIERFIAYRTYDRYNSIKIPTLSPNYYDKDTILLHGMFALLVDFIEVELASRQYACELHDNKNKNFLGKLKYRFCNSLPKNRKAELGLKYVDFYRNYTEECEYADAEDLKKYENKTRQFGNELFELYKWWTVKYPNRKDPMELSGWSDFCDLYRDKMHKFKEVRPELCYGMPLYEMYDELTPEQKEQEKQLLDSCWKIEEEQHQEDEDMLIRLIKIRRNLWT